MLTPFKSQLYGDSGNLDLNLVGLALATPISGLLPVMPTGKKKIAQWTLPLTRSVVQMPYEDVLPYPDFAVHIREHALFRLPEVLDAIISTEGAVRVNMTSQSTPYVDTSHVDNVGYRRASLHLSCSNAIRMGINR